MSEKQFRSADILMSIALILLGIYVCFESFGMILDNPDAQKRLGLSAGFIPMIVGVLLIFGSIIVLVHAIKHGGDLRLFAPKHIWAKAKSYAGINTIFIFGWTAIYIVIFMRVIPYFFATLIYLLVFMGRFETKHRRLIPIISVITALFVTYAFSSLVNIPLPVGNFWWR